MLILVTNLQNFKEKDYVGTLFFFAIKDTYCIRPRFLQKSPDKKRNYKKVLAELWLRLHGAERCAGETRRHSSASLDSEAPLGDQEVDALRHDTSTLHHGRRGHLGRKHHHLQELNTGTAV